MRRAAGAASSCCGCSSAGCLHPCACPVRPSWPPGLCLGKAAAHTCLHGRVGATGLARGHALCLGRRTKPVLHLPTDPRRLPPWSIYQFSKAASHGDKPNRNSCGAGHARWVRHILPIYLLKPLPPRSPATKRGCADTLEPFREAPLSFGTFCLRSMLLERLRFACPCKSGANLLSNFGIKTVSPG